MTEKISRPIVTDLDQLIALGFPPFQARCALKNTQGNKDEAIRMLRREMTNSSSGNESAWRGLTDDDWITYGISTSTFLPSDAESRGMIKSPIYAYLTAYRKASELNDEVMYNIHVTLKDRRSWNVEKSYQDFFHFYLKLPISIHNTFKTHFPTPKLFHIGEGYLEKRLKRLQDWVRELTLNEACMTDSGILHTTYAFLKAHEYGGPVTTENIQKRVLSSAQFAAPGAYQFQTNTKTIPAIEAQDPVNMTIFHALLPIKYDVDKLLGTEGLPSADPFMSEDMSDNQVAKDYQRDRVIINGKRVLGSQCTFKQLIDTCIAAISDVLKRMLPDESPVWDNDDRIRYVKDCLRGIGRTESAFLCHAMLGRVVDLPQNDLVVIPETSLATPIEILFSIKQKRPKSIMKPSLPIGPHAGSNMQTHSTIFNMPSYAPPPPPAATTGATTSTEINPPSSSSSSSSSPDKYYTATPIISNSSNMQTSFHDLLLDDESGVKTPDWCIMFEGQASMIFRLCDNRTMNPQIQVQTVCRKVIYGMPKEYASMPGILSLVTKPSNSSVYIDKELKTSSRDWM